MLFMNVQAQSGGSPGARVQRAGRTEAGNRSETAQNALNRVRTGGRNQSGTASRVQTGTRGSGGTIRRRRAGRRARGSSEQLSLNV